MLLAQGKFLQGFFLSYRINSSVQPENFFSPKRRGDNDIYKSPVIKEVMLMLLNLFYVSPHLLHYTQLGAVVRAWLYT